MAFNAEIPMSNLSIADDLFFGRTDITERGAQAALARA